MKEKLTMAQVYVLRRMKSGTEYSIRGDLKRAREIRYTGRWSSDDITCRSTPVLFRLGMIEMSNRFSEIEASLYYRVKLTAKGLEALRDNADR